MKKTIKGYLLGFLSAVIIVGGVTAFAANTTTLYNVLANGIKIVVDGKKINPTDAAGKTVEPIIYNGTTYLPVRAVENAIGKAVYWDGPNYTVYLGDKGGELEYPTVKLEDMTSIGDNVYKTDKLTDNYENTYDHAIKNEWHHTNLEYLCNMKYSKFKGTLYVPKGVSSDESCYLTVTADGKTIYKSPEMTKASAPVDIDVNITGYNDIKIDFSNGSYSSNFILCLGNAGFYQ